MLPYSTLIAWNWLYFFSTEEAHLSVLIPISKAAKKWVWQTHSKFCSLENEADTSSTNSRGTPGFASSSDQCVWGRHYLETPFLPVTLGVEVSVLCGAAPLPWVTLLLTAWMLFLPEVGFILAASWIFCCFMECWWILGVPQRGVVPVVVLSRLHQAGWAESSSFLWSGSFTDSCSKACLLTWHLRDTSMSSMIDRQVWRTELCLKHLVFV